MHRTSNSAVIAAPSFRVLGPGSGSGFKPFRHAAKVFSI